MEQVRQLSLVFPGKEEAALGTEPTNDVLVHPVLHRKLRSTPYKHAGFAGLDEQLQVFHCHRRADRKAC